MWNGSPRNDILPERDRSEKIDTCAYERKYQFLFHILPLWKYLLEHFFVFSPVFMDLDAQGEKYFHSEDIFEHESGFRSDALYFFASFSDHDDLLRIGFYIDIDLCF